jgi:hypothetical protein
LYNNLSKNNFQLIYKKMRLNYFGFQGEDDFSENQEELMIKFISLLMFIFAVNAQANHIQFMGEARLDVRQDVDVINTIGNCPNYRNQSIYALQLRVYEASANIDQLLVQYGNGQWDELHVREDFRPGSTSRWIDLPGGKRCVEKIIISGDSEGHHNRKAVVQFYGLR